MSRSGTFLRDLIKPQPNVPDEVAITTTGEFLAFLDPDLVWKWRLNVTSDEALVACELILSAMRGGENVDWQMEALEYLDRARAQLGARAEAPVDVAMPVAMDGAVSEPVEADPLVSEFVEPDVQAPREPDIIPPPPEERPPQWKVREPGLPGSLKDIIEFSKHLAGELVDQGDLEDGFAKNLLELADEGAALLISVGLLIGAYVVASKFVGDRIVIMWSADATGAVFERHLSRALRPLAELEENLRRQEEIVRALQRLEGSGAGIQWKTKGEHFSPRAVAQIDDMACGPACVEMIMEDHGLPPMAQESIARIVRGDTGTLTTSVEGLAEFLSTIDPEGAWIGGSHPATWPDVGDNMLNMARRLSAGGSWIADARVPGAARIGHFVLVEGIGDDGTVSVRDPWAWLAGEKVTTDATRQSTGAIYQIGWKEFHQYWTGAAVWSRSKGP